MRVIVFKDQESASLAAARMVAEQMNKKPEMVLGLATGSTPIRLYEHLIDFTNQGLISFKDITTFNLDEYVGLSPDHDQSYSYFMHHHLFDHVDLPAERINLINGEALDISGEGAAYDARIQQAGGVDLQILGLGRNGHIGFNEPSDYFTAGTQLVELDDKTITDNARFFTSIDQVPRQAISMGIKTIMHAKKILLLAFGENKAETVQAAVQGKIRPELPASVLQLHPDVTFIVDKKAGALLQEGPYLLEKM